MAARRASRKRKPKTGNVYKVVARDARGRFAKGRKVKTFDVYRPDEHVVHVKTREQAARILIPTLSPFAGRREFNAAMKQIQGRVLGERTITNATFADLTGTRMLPRGLKKTGIYTARVTFERRHPTTGAVISTTVYTARGGRDAVVPKIINGMGAFTDAEKARLYSGPSGGEAAEAFDVPAELSFRERQGMLDKRGAPRLSMRIEILGR